MTDAGPRRRERRALGWLLVLVGLGLLSYVGWQMLGTNVVAERRHREVTRSLEQEWAAGQRFVRIERDVVARALIRIPKFGPDYAVPVLEGVSEEALASGYGHFEQSATPGAVGNYALAGHRVTHGEPLRDMPSLVPGDEVVVETGTHVYTYVLDTGGDDLEVPFTETWVLDPVPDNPDQGEPEPAQRTGQRLITLTTCAELFHTDNRLIAFGHLESRERK